MSDSYPSFDDVIYYRRNKLVARLEELGLTDAAEARVETLRLLLDYVNDEEIRRAARWAARVEPERPGEEGK